MANKSSELSDFSVCTTWGVKGRYIYLLDVLRKRMAYPELKRRVCEQAREFRATVILIEDSASGTQLIQELNDEGLNAVTACRPTADKVMRLNAQTATIENGFVYLPREALWLTDYLNELTTFPNAKYDDQTDSTSQALGWIKEKSWDPTPLLRFRQYYTQGQMTEYAPASSAQLAEMASAPDALVRRLTPRSQSPQATERADDSPGENLKEIYLRSRRRFFGTEDE
jgi:predicted phage terminase large subunit-like protein